MDIPVSDQIRNIIRESGFTQADLSARSGVSQSRISEFLAGGPMKTSNVDRILSALSADSGKILKIVCRRK